MLSDNAIQGYVNYWHSSYVAGKAIDISAQADSSMRFKDLIETGISSHGLPVSRAVYRELLARISQVPYAGRDQRKALVEYIANVIMPFSETHGQNLQAAVGALSVGWKKHTPRLIDIPGPFVEFLTNSDLADYYQRRGLERLHGDQNPHRQHPPGYRVGK